jgi:hypothetical protein
LDGYIDSNGNDRFKLEDICLYSTGQDHYGTRRLFRRGLIVTEVQWPDNPQEFDSYRRLVLYHALQFLKENSNKKNLHRELMKHLVNNVFYSTKDHLSVGSSSLQLRSE